MTRKHSCLTLHMFDNIYSACHYNLYDFGLTIAHQLLQPSHKNVKGEAKIFSNELADFEGNLAQCRSLRPAAHPRDAKCHNPSIVPLKSDHKSRQNPIGGGNLNFWECYSMHDLLTLQSPPCPS